MSLKGWGQTKQVSSDTTCRTLPVWPLRAVSVLYNQWFCRIPLSRRRLLLRNDRTTDSAIFKKSLYTEIDNWPAFMTFYLANLLSYIFGTVLPLSDSLHNLDSKVLDFLIRDRQDALHHRGKICFNQALKHRANTVATFQYACFIIFITAMPYNAKVFVRFSDGAGFDRGQQLLFVLVAWVLCATQICRSCPVVQPSHLKVLRADCL